MTDSTASSDVAADSPDEGPDNIRRRRLLFRCWHRGTKESDLLLGSFAERHLLAFDSGQLDRFETLLLESDPDIYTWMTGRETPPSDLDTDVMRLLQAHKNEFAGR